MKTQLICADNVEIDGGRVYYLSSDNKRHWIPSPEVAVSYGWDLGTVVKLPMEKIIDYPLSFSVAKNFTSTSLMQYIPGFEVLGGYIKEKYGGESGLVLNSKDMDLK